MCSGVSYNQLNDLYKKRDKLCPEIPGHKLGLRTETENIVSIYTGKYFSREIYVNRASHDIHVKFR